MDGWLDRHTEKHLIFAASQFDVFKTDILAYFNFSKSIQCILHVFSILIWATLKVWEHIVPLRVNPYRDIFIF